MRIRVNVNDADASDAIKNYVERRLRFTLGRFGRRVGHITVRIRPDGPSGNQCRIRAEVVPFGQVIAEQTDSDLFAAVDRAAGKIGRQFGRELERIRSSRVGRDSVRLVA
ncbi:MAG TPA: HPF/RaiA family ribosome-associated protein [Terriglobales bacterium]|nr:HPF/RaiA family ribosome-associated protein [Terriglobales bacterium]